MISKKKKIIISVLVITIIFLIFTIALFLLLKTDLFKSNKEEFYKYLSGNVDNLELLETTDNKTDFERQLETVPYLENTEITMNYIKNTKTTSVDKENAINNLKLILDGQIDKKNQYETKTVKLINGTEQEIKIDTIKEKNIKGIRFEDLYLQYLLVNKETNIKDLLKKAGLTQEEINNISKKEINKESDKKEITTQEKEILKNKYLNCFKQNFEKSKYTKQKNILIDIHGQKIMTNEYTLTLSKEELNNIYINLLETLKTDDIILEKLEQIDNTLKKSNKTNWKQETIKEIDEEIEKIKQKNIGNETVKIIIYESEEKTLRTNIQGVNYTITFDFLQTAKDQFAEMLITKDEKEEERWTLKRNNEKTIFSILNNKDNEPITIVYEENKKAENNKQMKKTVLKYEDGNNKIKTNIAQKLTIVEGFPNPNIKDKIKLEDLNEEQLKQIINKIKTDIGQRKEELKNKIKVEDLREVLNVLGISKEKEETKESQAEIKRKQFNYKYEILQGKNLNSENVIQIINNIKDVFYNIETNSDKEFKIEIKENKGNPELAKELIDFINKNQDKEYNISIEYGKENIIKYIVLTMVEK